MAESSKRHTRDSRAIVWTVRSLTDNNELESFVDALPDLVWGPDGRRRAHDQMITVLLDSQDVQLVPRIEGLLQSCDSACEASSRGSFPIFDATILASQLNHSNALVRCHSASAHWLVRWIGYCSLSFFVRHLLFILETSESVPNPVVLLRAVQREAEARGYIGLSIALSQIDSVHRGDHLLIRHLQHALRSFEDTAHNTVLDYMQCAANMHEMPYEFEVTCQIMQPSCASTSLICQKKLKETLSAVLDRPVATIKALDCHLDIIVGTILSILQKRYPQSFDDAPFGRDIVNYVTPRNYREGFRRALVHCVPHRLGSLLTKYLKGDPGNLTQNTVYSIWVLCLSTPSLATFDEKTLGAVSVAPPFPISPCAIAMLKSQIVTDAAELPPDKLSNLMNRLQILDSTFDHEERRKQAHFTILIGFLEHHSTVTTLEPVVKNRRTAIETFQFLARRCTQKSAPQSLQLRFAAWIRNLDDPSWYSDNDMIRAVIDWLYNSTSCEPFDDMDARRMISDALTSYRAALPPDQGSLHGRARALAFTLNSRLGNLGITAVLQMSVT
ncbi:hypothetical protein DFH08DRAFT_1055375 [Mycena albidolilacea]|uniref:Uncharacterized protein n=1 Tax=Mycena albidolilacea TaxID=1033008 RepID=A0AAD7EAA6_9AGAR|nr:hypothetical protein DFH08DRAFT_1055375 [Mycena albidolilacea]